MNTFRSHLMQQFVTAARSQSRPPLALIGLLSDETDASTRFPKDSTPKRPPLARTSHSALSHPASTLHPSMSALAVETSPTRSSSAHHQNSLFAHEHLISSLSLEESEQDAAAAAAANRTDSLLSKAQPPLRVSPQLKTAAAFQHLLATRHTTSSRFAAPSKHTIPERDAAYWKEAIDRAIQCGLTAPKKRRTEAVRFKRILTAASTARLADIAYEVRLRRRPVMNAETSSLSSPQQQAAAAAERKRTKWSQVPAFLVTLLESSQRQDKHHGGGDEDDEDDDIEYKPLAFVPLQDQDELDEYAAACAVVQTAMLSLHAEQIASKWITSSSRNPIVQTPAFRQFVQARPNDRVVALLMVGEPLPPSQSAAAVAIPPRRWSLEDVLEDI